MNLEDDLSMRLAGFMHIEPIQDLCEHLLCQELDRDTRLYVEQVQESLIEFEDILDEIEDRELSMTVDDTIGQLEILASVFELHAMRLAKRAHTTCRALHQNAYFVALRRTQQETQRTQEHHTKRSKERVERVCSSCGGDLVVRTRRVDNAPFWGCEHFPTCRRAVSMSTSERAALKR